MITDTPRPATTSLVDFADDPVGARLTSMAFANRHAAHSSLRRLAKIWGTEPGFEDFLSHLLAVLAEAANPDAVLISLERFADSVPDPRAFFHFLAGNPRVLEMLVTLFAGSQFLTDILLRNPEYFEHLIARKGLAQLKDVQQFYAEAEAIVSPLDSVASQLDALRRFQRWELLRIGACDFFDLWDMPTATAQLSHLADAAIRVSLDIAASQTGTPTDGFAVLALGKLGGQELNYSSDIDLLFIAGTDPSRYSRLGQRLIEALGHVTTEGFLYRVDMRLRPWGRTGALISSVTGYVAYLRQHARLWEKQALLKARVVAGDDAIGGEFLRQAEPIIFDSAADAVRANVREMKERTEAHLKKHGREWGEVKLGEGSIRDAEFVTQYLQLIHGGKLADLRQGRTLDALSQLFAHGFLPVSNYRVLTDGYTFLRTVEHHLQLMHNRQISTLPSDPEDLSYFARRLGFQGKDASTQFLTRYHQHSRAIRKVYQAYLGSNDVDTPTQLHKDTREIGRHVARMAPSYTEAFSPTEIERHAELVARLDENNLIEVDAVPQDNGCWRVTIVGYDYLGELSMICGLLFVYGFNIFDGHVFTYEPAEDPSFAARQPHRRLKYWQRRRIPNIRKKAQNKIVDVFTVKPARDEVTEDIWPRYAEDLVHLVRQLRDGQRREARGELARRFADALRDMPETAATLYPVDVEIDNTSSDRYTILHIKAPDTIGFLYELTNALALQRVNIARVTFDSTDNGLHDILYVTDATGHKITAPSRQRELRAATVLVKHFTHLLPRSPNPEAALLHFREFVGQLFTHSDWPDELASLEDPEVLGALARLLGVSDFLWNDFLRMQYANLYPVVRDVDALSAAKPKAQLETELERALRHAPNNTSHWEILNAFKDREMFRIDMRHILGQINAFGQFSQELTELAEVVVDTAYRLCFEELDPEFGLPLLADGTRCPLSVCALGKLGGCELGFASDIELMFIYAGNGMTTGPRVLTTSEFFEKFVQLFANAIRAKREGIFEIDLRLRPYGKAGSMAVSLESFHRYFAPDGPAWDYERQALIRLRPIAGAPRLGKTIVELRNQLIYSGAPFDVAAMRAMRERQLRHLVTAGTINAKYSPGGVVDVEYLVQGLQITHGHQNPGLRQTNTCEAMAALQASGILSSEDYRKLRDAYMFLRQLIDALRMVRGNAKDLTVPPTDSEEFSFLAGRLGYGSNVASLDDDLTYHTTCVHELNARLFN